MGEVIDHNEKVNSVRSLLRSIPKAELHVHIEGTLEPELLFKIAARNNIKVEHARDSEHLKSLYNFSNLQSFLDLYYQGVNCLKTEEDFYELTKTYLDRVWSDGCRHVEMFFDPQSHTHRGIDVGVVINGISRALTEAREQYGLTSYLIMCFLKHLTEEDAFEVLEKALPYLVSNEFVCKLKSKIKSK